MSKLLAASAAIVLACGGSTSAVNDAAPSVDAGVPTPAIVFFDTATNATTTRMLWADPLDIRITGLPAHAEATVTARFTGWGAAATFMTDAAGSIDLATVVPTSGSYSGADADGIVWSMTASTSPDDPPNDPYTLRVHVDVAGTALVSASLTRIAKTDDVTCVSVSDSGLVGYYCAKTGAPPRGALITFGGSEGGLGTGKSQAMYFASLGYPSLGLAYFGATGVPATLENVPLEYFQTAITWVEMQPTVLPGKVAVLGGSRGGELALLLGATFPQITAVVAELPSGLVWPGIGVGFLEVPAWTLQGQPLAYIPAAGTEAMVTEPDGVVAYSDRQAFFTSIAMATQAQVDAATTHVENTNGPVLMLGGASDELWPACDLAKFSMDRLSKSGHATKYADTLVCYPDAGHNVDSFTVGVPTTSAMHTSTPVDGQILALGGTAAGISHAARDADNRIRAFLAQNL